MRNEFSSIRSLRMSEDFFCRLIKNIFKFFGGNKSWFLSFIWISCSLEASTQLPVPTSKQTHEESKTIRQQEIAIETDNAQRPNKEKQNSLSGAESQNLNALIKNDAPQVEPYLTFGELLARNAGKPSVYPRSIDGTGDLKGFVNFESSPKISYSGMLDSVRDTIGDSAYSKLLWTYYDIKEIDNLIYTKMAQYDFSHSVFSEGFRSINGLNQQFGASIMVSNRLGAPNENPMFQGEFNKTPSSAGGKTVLNIPEQSLENVQSDVLENSYFALILRFLTVKNLIYAMLAAFLGGLLLRVVRFFIKQDLS